MLRDSNIEAQVLTQSSTMPVFSLETHASFSADNLKNKKKKKNTQQVSGRGLKGLCGDRDPRKRLYANSTSAANVYWTPQLGFLQMVSWAGDPACHFCLKETGRLRAHGPRIVAQQQGSGLLKVKQKTNLKPGKGSEESS